MIKKKTITNTGINSGRQKRCHPTFDCRSDTATSVGKILNRKTPTSPQALSDGVDSELVEVSREGDEGVILDLLPAVDGPVVVAVEGPVVVAVVAVPIKPILTHLLAGRLQTKNDFTKMNFKFDNINIAILLLLC